MLGPKALCKLTVSYFYRSTLPTCKAENEQTHKLVLSCSTRSSMQKYTFIISAEREKIVSLLFVLLLKDHPHTYKEIHSAPICYINSFVQLSSLELSYLWSRNSEVIPCVKFLCTSSPLSAGGNWDLLLVTTEYDKSDGPVTGITFRYRMHLRRMCQRHSWG